jgi:predicted phage terminase large subunit-like protein
VLIQKPRRLRNAALPWRTWLQAHFAMVVTAPFGTRHERLWEWFDALTQGTKPRPRVEIWPRGGAKSSTAELACTRLCAKLSRRYVLYVSETQDQADKHVQAVAGFLEQIGVERAVNVYGHSKGWRRQELRTANGFNVSAYGLDTAARGVKLDQYRPDLIVFDDIDSQHDSPKTVDKKIESITTAIIPAGAADCAYLFLQNKVHEDSIVARLADGRADFLHSREPAFEEPAVRGLVTESEPTPEGGRRYRITAGEATWAGQSLTVCEQQINEWGLRAFQREAQHDVRGTDGYVFNTDALRYIDASEVPADLKRCRAWDLAATEGGGDHTAGVLLGVQVASGAVYVLDVRRGQWGSDRVMTEIERTAEADGCPYSCRLRLPQDPAQAGKAQASHFRGRFAQYRPIIQPITGDKATRATGLAEEVNKGNVYVVRGDWNFALTEELRRFREDGSQTEDDQVDAAADAYNQVGTKRTFRTSN